MGLKSLGSYFRFGLRRPWLEDYFENGTDCFVSQKLGVKQYDALKIWLREAELLNDSKKGDKSGTPTELFPKLLPLGSGSPLTWAIIWTNLCYNSSIIKWYALNSVSGETYTKDELIELLGNGFAPSTRGNAITAMFEIFKNSPIGAGLGQGIPLKSGNIYKYKRTGWERPDASVLLYSLYRFAEKTGSYNFTLRQLIETRSNDEVTGVDPAAIFGIQPDAFKQMLQEIAIQFPNIIQTSFQLDLDTVRLVSEKKAIDMIDLCGGAE